MFRAEWRDIKKAILECLKDDNYGKTIIEIIRKTGLNPNAVIYMIETLINDNIIEYRQISTRIRLYRIKQQAI